MAYIYSLRIGICPDFMAEEKFLQLEEFCKQAKIDDVQFFINMEEVNDGHLTLQETRPWLDMLAGFIPRLRAQGITVSLNPWITTLHTDRGRKLKPGQNFTTMVDFRGKAAEAVACPLCPAFREYIAEMYREYAKLGFDTIWVEDDFRLHNHAPLEWGGCFCERHMREFEKRLGHSTTREEFVERMTAPGRPTPERIAWLDTMRDTMNDFARLLGDAVHEVAPHTRVALMSSAPQNHAIEGRQWEVVLRNLSGETRPLDRPHLPAYNEVSGRQYYLEFQRYSRLTAALLPAVTEKWPELDNLPHTRFSKSHRFAQLEMESTLALCAEGVTINVFDMIGNCIAAREHNDRPLAQLKPYLEAVRGLGANTQNEQGVCVLADLDTVYTLHTRGGEGPGALFPWQTFWAEYLSAFGIANHIAVSPRPGETVALGGQVLRGMDPEAIRTLARQHRLLLDGESIEILLEKGCGDLIGAKSARWHALNGGYQSYEQLRTGLTLYDLPDARMSAQAIFEAVESADYLEVEYEPSARCLTTLRTARGEIAGPGVCLTDGAILFPYGHMKNSYQMLLHPVRQELLSGLIDRACAAQVTGCQFVSIHHFPVEQGQMILLVNCSTDRFEEPALLLPFGWEECRQVDRETGVLEKIRTVRRGGAAKLKCTLEPLQTACFVFR